MELLEVNPYLWRVARSGQKRTLVWSILVVLAVLWALWVSPNYLEPGVDLFLLIPAGFVLKAWMAAEASRTFSEDRRSGALELLLSTPFGAGDIVRGQLAALWRQFGPPVIAVLLAYLIFLIAGTRPPRMADDPTNWLMFHLVLGGFLVGDMIALSWVGMWLGLINRKPNRAALLAFTRIVLLPPLLFVGLMSLWALGSGNTGDSGPPALLWIFLGVVVDLHFGLEARARLHAEFRTIVSEGRPRKRAAEPAPGTAAVLAEAP
jgi:ABC-type transport system involved in cytochrome c biogenesis permease component